MPPVYAIISFFSYRFFRDYTYYELIQVGKYPTSQSRPLARSDLSQSTRFVAFFAHIVSSRSTWTKGCDDQRFCVRTIPYPNSIVFPELQTLQSVTYRLRGIYCVWP